MKQILTAMSAFAVLALAAGMPATAKHHEKGDAMQPSEALAAIVAHERRGEDKAPRQISQSA